MTDKPSTTEEKTPAARPAKAPPSALPDEGPASIAKYVAGLPTMSHVEAIEAKIAELLAKVTGFATRLEEFFHKHTELVTLVDAHEAELGQMNGLLTEIASAARKRDAQRPPAARLLPTAADAEGDLSFDPTKPGTHVRTLPSGGVVEVNVRKPGPAGGAMIRNGKPVASSDGKVRRS